VNPLRSRFCLDGKPDRSPEGAVCNGVVVVDSVLVGEDVDVTMNLAAPDIASSFVDRRLERASVRVRQRIVDVARVMVAGVMAPVRLEVASAAINVSSVTVGRQWMWWM